MFLINRLPGVITLLLRKYTNTEVPMLSMLDLLPEHLSFSSLLIITSLPPPSDSPFSPPPPPHSLSQ